MTHAPGRSSRFVLMSLALACVALASCREDSVAPRHVQTPEGPMADMGTVIVDVNLKTRTVTTHPMVSGSLSAPAGVSAAMYGAASLITHHFVLDGGAPTVDNTFILRDRIENNLAWRIGTHVAGAIGAYPQDTMGVFVFISIPPVVESGCTPDPDTCAVADSGDGEFNFTTLDPQPYIFFKTVLEPSDGTPLSGLDYTDQSGISGLDYSRAFAFHASPGVTDFHFGVSVSAAWVRPHDTQWTVRYTGDSMPTRFGTTLDTLHSEPDWRVASRDVVDSTIFTAACPFSAFSCLLLQNGTPTNVAPDSIVYFRSDSLAPGDTAFIDALFTTSHLKANNPSVFLSMNDGTKLIEYGFALGKSGFVNAANGFIVGAQTTTAADEWRIVKFGTDSAHAVALPQDTIVASVAYSLLTPAPALAPRTRYFWFGQRVTFATPAGNNPVNVSSEWVNVTYGIFLP